MDITEFLSSNVREKPFAAVLGHPVAHSRSPAIHNAALKYHALPVSYHAIDCPPEKNTLLPELFSLPAFRGANITIPLKQDIIGYLNETDETSQEIGAVNTVVPSGHAGVRPSGFNTDAYGFQKPLEGITDLECAVVLGAGGACRAVVYALRKSGFKKIYVASRRAGSGLSKLPGQVDIIDYSVIKNAVMDSDIIVNTTPVGMYPKVDGLPVPEDLIPLLKGKICYDIIYNPLETRFLKEARKHEAKTIGGLDMFIYQAARSFELWFDKPMPLEMARSIIISDLNS